MITTIIFSRDRPAQLDLLLRSLERNGGGQFDPWVICQRYGKELVGKGDGLWTVTLALEFEEAVRSRLAAAGEFVCFMCDDGILYRPLPPMLEPPWGVKLLCFSLRLGFNTRTCYPSGLTQEVPRNGADDEGVFAWNWTREPRGPGLSDFGYPGSLDGHVFRSDDVRRMLDGRSFPNPTALECALVEGCAELAAERPLLACYPHSVYVGNPVNRVSEQSGVRFGQRFPVTAAECNRRFLAGERIDLDALDFSAVDGAHTEIELRWETL